MFRKPCRRSCARALPQPEGFADASPPIAGSGARAARGRRHGWVALLGATALGLAAAGPAEARTPAGFFGVVADGPLGESRHVDPYREMRRMRAGGVRTVRIAMHWNQMQPWAPGTQPMGARKLRDLGGVPADVHRTDVLVRAAARAGLSVLPVVEDTPHWAGEDPNATATEATPPDPQRYAAFVRALVERYGRGGTFFDEEGSRTPERPITWWQLWNEPDLSSGWSGRPWAPTYVQNALRPGHDAVKAADPRARVVAAGMTNTSWEDLETLYRAGAEPYLDMVDIHPYTARPAGVVEIARRNRAVIDRYDADSTRMLITEFGWSSGRGKAQLSFPWDTSEAGQASRVRESLRRLAAARRSLGIARVYWYTWIGYRTPQRPASGFRFAGLRDYRFPRTRSKPAYFAFRATVRALTR